MELDDIVQSCVCVTHIFAQKENLQGFELLTYEQACRTLESVFKSFRETWETTNESGNCQE